jgi:hypothetical protein
MRRNFSPRLVLVVISFCVLLGLATQAARAQNADLLYSFANFGSRYPMASLILDSSGNLYGTTNQNPTAGLVMDSSGNLYGTTPFRAGSRAAGENAGLRDDAARAGAAEDFPKWG